MIDKQLRAFAWFRPPLTRATAGLAHIFMPLLPKCIDKTKLDYRLELIGGIRHHIFEPKEKTSNKIIYYVHGGGFVFNMYTVHFKLIQEYAVGLGVTVYAVDYSLLPQHGFPTQVNEVCSALAELRAKSQELIMMGDSAGGSIILDAYLQAKKKGIDIKSLVLIYPVVSSAMQTQSMREFESSPLWNSKLNKKMWEWYIGDKEYKDLLESVAELELELEDLYIEVCEVDCLRDEGIELFEGLSKVKNRRLYYNKGCYHGFELCYWSKAARAAVRERLNFLSSIINKEK